MLLHKAHTGNVYTTAAAATSQSKANTHTAENGTENAVEQGIVYQWRLQRGKQGENRCLHDQRNAGFYAELSTHDLVSKEKQRNLEKPVDFSKNFYIMNTLSMIEARMS